MALAPGASMATLAERLRDLSPADLEAISNAARRFAFNRAPDSSQLPPLILADFEKAVQRVRGTVLQISKVARTPLLGPRLLRVAGKNGRRPKSAVCATPPFPSIS